MGRKIDWPNTATGKYTIRWKKIMRARERVIRAAKRWSRLYMHSKPCQCSECLLARAVDALLKLEKESNGR